MDLRSRAAVVAAASSIEYQFYSSSAWRWLSSASSRYDQRRRWKRKRQGGGVWCALLMSTMAAEIEVMDIYLPAASGGWVEAFDMDMILVCLLGSV